jgi:hypothetical protein
MDNITHAFKVAKAHYNDSPVWNLWSLRWSKQYHFLAHIDYLAHSIRLGRMLDSSPVIAILEDERIPTLDFMLENSKEVWRRK